MQDITGFSLFDTMTSNRRKKFRPSKRGRGEPEKQWAALRAAHEKVGQFSESQILVPEVGVEPTWTKSPRDFEFLDFSA
jgi:hypothetical protein